MYSTLSSSSTSFRLGEVSTGEPHLYCAGALADRHYLSRLQLRTAIAIHLPRLVLMACGATALLFGLVVSTRAEGPAFTADCAARDLKVASFLEQHGEAGDLPAAALGEFGSMHLEARLTCAAGEEARALAIYDDILGAVRTAQRSEP